MELAYLLSVCVQYVGKFVLQTPAVLLLVDGTFVDTLILYQPFSPQILILTHQQQTAFENIVGKGEIAHNEQFLLFAQCIQLSQTTVSPFVHIFDIIS